MHRHDAPPPGLHFVVKETDFGQFAVAWHAAPGPRVLRVFLPARPDRTLAAVRQDFPAATPCSDPEIARLSARLRQLLAGEPVEFTTDLLDLDRCSTFQRRVLLEERRIPRGRVRSYGVIARAVGRPGAARAVGRALARNPFPLVIPCHRAVRSDGTLGGFQGGLVLKRALLELEGIEFTPAGRVAAACHWRP